MAIFKIFWTLLSVRALKLTPPHLPATKLQPDRRHCLTEVAAVRRVVNFVFFYDAACINRPVSSRSVLRTPSGGTLRVGRHQSALREWRRGSGTNF